MSGGKKCLGYVLFLVTAEERIINSSFPWKGHAAGLFPGVWGGQQASFPPVSCGSLLG